MATNSNGGPCMCQLKDFEIEVVTVLSFETFSLDPPLTRQASIYSFYPSNSTVVQLLQAPFQFKKRRQRLAPQLQPSLLLASSIGNL